MTKKIILMVTVLVCVCACTGQGSLPPFPEDALEVNADLVITSQDDQTGDVFIDYTLTLTNVSDEVLERVILKDFLLPSEIAMEKDSFEIRNLGPGETKAVTFTVIVRGWGLNPKDQTWEVDFTIRIEKGDAYTEQDVFYYVVHLIPQ